MATQGKIARHLDLSTRALQDLMDREVVPRSSDLDEVRVAYIRHLRARAAGHGGEDGLDLATERARLDRARAELAEHQLAERRGELMPVVDGEFAVATFASGLHQRLLAIPNQCAPDAAVESDPSAVAEIVRRYIIEALAELSGLRIVKAKGPHARELEALLLEFREHVHQLLAGEATETQ